ncbi:MAG: response regulator [Bacteroidaceae bacterium]|nr:response regulator [Bacteroidaceae bacterium]
MGKYGSVLVVDDNPSILMALKICLRGTFENVLTLSSPDMLLSRLKQEIVDVVLLDMNFALGVNSGQEGLWWLHKIHEEYPDLPIVLMTAYAEVQLAVRGLKSGAVDFVTKPWDNDSLIRVLKDAVDSSHEVVQLDKLENDYVRRVVSKCHGNISEASKLLGITRQTLYRKLQESNFMS